jgi:U2 small nuclear ribonucleoprotein B''
MNVELKRCLYGLFSQYGQILDVIALKTPKMRGQAFIVYKELPSAVAAMRALQGYPFFGKSLRIQFGRTQSKATREFELYAVEPARQEQTSKIGDYLESFTNLYGSPTTCTPSTTTAYSSIE